jgi:hypothetical protein
MATPIVKTATGYVVLRDPLDNILIEMGTAIPGAVAGYAKGATFLKTDVVTGTGGTYLNKGTTASASFTLVTQA